MQFEINAEELAQTFQNGSIKINPKSGLDAAIARLLIEIEKSARGGVHAKAKLDELQWHYKHLTSERKKALRKQIARLKGLKHLLIFFQLTTRQVIVYGLRKLLSELVKSPTNEENVVLAYC